jgi:hypothetical protein
MDDAIFDNVHSMTEQQIRNFINSRPTSCLATSGAIFPEPITYWQYGGNVDAARVIYNSAVYNDINPQVILATLQKEQTLITRTNCYEQSGIDSRNKAMGMGCPDGGACPAPAYAGFQQQVMKGSWALTFARQRASGATEWGDNGSIVYNGPWTPGNRKACSTCTDVYRDGYWTVDGQSILMETGATASFYRYTPHLGQALPGIFESWFGPTTGIANGLLVQNITQPSASPARGQAVTYTISLTNRFTIPVTLDAVGVVGRLGSMTGANRDLGWQGPVTLQANETKQFSFTQVLKDTGPIYLWPAINYQGSYVQYSNWGAVMNVRMPDLITVNPLTSSRGSSLVAGQTTTLSVTIKNNESQPIYLDAVGIPVRYLDTYNYDVGWSSLTTPLAPGATKVISADLLLDKPGDYKAWGAYTYASQFAMLSAILQMTVKSATPQFQLTYLETPNPTPALGEDVVVKFKLKNNSGVPMTLDAVGVVGRYDNAYSGANRDFGWNGPVTFADGEEKSFTDFVSNVSELKNFYAWVAINYKGAYTHYNTWGFSMVPHQPNLSLSAPLTVNSGTQPTMGQTVPVTATIHNNEPKPIRLAAAGIPVRFYGRYNYDATWQGPLILAASGTSGDSAAMSGTVKFDKPGPYTIWASALVQGFYLTVGSPTTITMN